MSPTDEDGAAIGGGDGNHRGLHDGFLPALKMESHFTASRISVRHESHRPQLEQLNRIPTDILEPDHKLRRGLDVGKISASENGQLVATASGRTGSTGSRKTVSERRDFSGQGSIGRIDQGRRGFATSEGRTKGVSSCLFYSLGGSSPRNTIVCLPASSLSETSFARCDGYSRVDPGIVSWSPFSVVLFLFSLGSTAIAFEHVQTILSGSFTTFLSLSISVLFLKAVVLTNFADHSTCLFILSITLSVECLKSLPDPPNAPSLAPIDRAQAE
ncbi:hypothetical protein C8J56DRAFT_1051557 [Mycena floridula]|nr:hypothetical protein C8J56DRAFT_1051557 [Mycena floridula]